MPRVHSRLLELRMQALTTRLATGKWTGISPNNLDLEAKGLGPYMNYPYLNNQYVYVAPQFESYQSPVFLRPFDAFSH